MNLEWKRSKCHSSVWSNIKRYYIQRLSYDLKRRWFHTRQCQFHFCLQFEFYWRLKTYFSINIQLEIIIVHDQCDNMPVFTSKLLACFNCSTKKEKKYEITINLNIVSKIASNIVRKSTCSYNNKPCIADANLWTNYNNQTFCSICWRYIDFKMVWCMF